MQQKQLNTQVRHSIDMLKTKQEPCRAVHCKKAVYDVYIGRPSKWGNPFTHKPGTRANFILPTRQEALDAYRVWITVGEGKHLLNDLHELKGKTLGCWCHPQACHGDILAELVAQYCKDQVFRNICFLNH